MAGTKSFAGLDKLFYAIVTEDTADAYAASTPKSLAPVAMLSAEPATNSKVQFFDNDAKESLTSEGPTKLTAEVQGITLETLAELLGKTYDATNGGLSDSGATPPYVALGYRAKKTNGAYRYYWFFKGNCVEPKEEITTATDTPDPKTTKLEFNMVRTTHEFVQSAGLTASSKYRKNDSDDPAFTEAATWFDVVKIPVFGTPSAVTCTPLPVDGATGVALTADIVLTFNNALRSGAENGIVLLRSDTQAVIAVARTIDAARKVVTLNPSSSLITAKTYLVVVPGVVDVYGQTLADAAYDFVTV